ncbi:MAG TPA: ABC transporter ATP-binding protein [Beutenbergiaceae bacterium]|nr:ABC transporter ATP-binding protein [Beutenbergiaceae bacterium]
MSVRFDRVGLVRGDQVVLDEVSLDLAEHRVGLIGANGSGKSTLVRMINGLVRPTTGSVLVHGVDVGKHSGRVRSKVGFLFSDAEHQIVMPTVREDLEFSLRRRVRSRTERADLVTRAMAQFGLTEMADRPCHALSGGEKQLLALAAVLLAEPDVVVADEPTTLLDRLNARLIASRLAGLRQQVLLVTHHLDLLTDFDRVIVLHQGRVVADDVPARAIEHYTNLVG